MRSSSRTVRGLFVVCMATCALRAADNPAGWRIGIGSNIDEPDAAKAGEIAARQARQAYGEGEPKLVLVMAAAPMVTPEMLDGVARHWPRALIYGGQVSATLTPFSNHPDARKIDIDQGVAVLALGGNLDVDAVAEPTPFELDPRDAARELNVEYDEEDTVYLPYRLAGRRLGARILPAVNASTRPGKLIWTQGDQFTGSNVPFAAGLVESLAPAKTADGAPVPIVGGASGNQTAKEIVAGQIRTGVNYAVFIGGDFRLGMTRMGGVHAPETADKALATALEQGDGAEPFFAFIYNCRRRRTGMMRDNNLAEEHALMRARLGGAPFFGAYGPGEIGALRVGQASEGTGFSVVSAMLFPLGGDAR